MNSGLRLWLPILLVSSVLALGLAPSAKADAIYAFNRPDFSWSFQVSAIITTNANITSLQSINIPPGSPLSGCSFSNISVSNPTSPFPIVETFFDVNCAAPVVSAIFSVPIDHFGTFTDLEGATLTISEATSGVPEPTSLLLLAGGLASLLVLCRKMIG